MVWKPADDPLSKLAGTMIDSAQQVWLSSLSTLLKAQQEAGQQIANMLHFEGPRSVTARQPAAARGGDEEARAAAGDSVQALAERAFEARVVPLLQRGDVASRAEIERLTREVEELTRRVEALCRERERNDPGSSC